MISRFQKIANSDVNDFLTQSQEEAIHKLSNNLKQLLVPKLRFRLDYNCQGNTYLQNAMLYLFFANKRYRIPNIMDLQE